MNLLLYRKRVFIALVLLSATTTLMYMFRMTLFITWRDFAYLSRPIWGKESKNGPQNLIPHFYSQLIPPRNMCSLHHWTQRRAEKIPRVIDAFTFSIELDILEIRLKELWKVVDTFLIVEADRTFMGKDKPLVYLENKERFLWASEKIVHFPVRDLSENPVREFENEAKMRSLITKFIDDNVRPRNGDLIIVGDIDELPSAHTIELIKNCEGYPTELHLDTLEFMYSFEFKLPGYNWKPHVTTYTRSTFSFHHGHQGHLSNYRLADAGWHCSFCFRYISDFVFKMTSYSHNDRVTRKKQLERGEIQRKICDGENIFDMFPEVYSFRDLIIQMGKMEKTSSVVGLPQHVLENPGEFRFLLPGGCLREKEPRPRSRIRNGTLAKISS